MILLIIEFLLMSRFLNSILTQEQKKMTEMKNSLLKEEKVEEREREVEQVKSKKRRVVKIQGERKNSSSNDNDDLFGGEHFHFFL